MHHGRFGWLDTELMPTPERLFYLATLAKIAEKQQQEMEQAKSKIG